MHSPADLAAAERAFGYALTASGQPSDSAPWQAFAGDTAQIARRFAAYRRNVLGNWRAALASTYPVLEAFLGRTAFLDLTDAYLAQHPSADGDLDAYGAALPEFLESDTSARRWPFLPALARLERALLQAYRAPATKGFDLTALAAVPPDRQAELRLTVWVGALTVVSAHPIVSLWQAHQLPPAERDAALAELPDAAESALTFRAGGLVSAVALSPGDTAFVESCRAGEPLATAIEIALVAAAGAKDRFDPAAALQRLVRLQTLTGFDSRTSERGA